MPEIHKSQAEIAYRAPAEDLVRESNPQQRWIPSPEDTEYLPWASESAVETGILASRPKNCPASPVQDGKYPLQYCTFSMDLYCTIHSIKQSMVSKEQLFNLGKAEG